jgi:hydrogenase maturation protease
MNAPGPVPALVIGVGNDYRRDDAAGLHVARRLRAAGVSVVEQTGEGAALMEAWRDAPAVIMVDAVQSGAPPGTIHRLDARAGEIPRDFFHYSTHAFSVAEAVELARALGQLPPWFVVYGIEGSDFTCGTGLSPEVEAAAQESAERILTEIQPC